MRSLARWCFRHKVIVVVSWVLALFVLGGLSASAGTGYTDSFSLPGTESTTALNLLTDNFNTEATDTNQVVFAADNVNDPATKARIEKTLDAIAKGPHVERVDSPFAEGAAARQISKDGTVAFANVHMDGEQPIADVPKEAYEKLIDTAEAGRGDGLQVELGGSGIQQANQDPGGGPSEFIGFIAAAIVLAIAFGSLWATLLPLLSAVLALGTGISLIGLLAHVIDIATFAPTLATLIGLGVGIDYSLFVVTRHRNAIKAGRDPEAACIRAMNTSGRAVLFAGAHGDRGAARPVRARHQLPQRRRGSVGYRRARHDDGGRHADPGAPRDDRDARAVEEGAAPARRGGPARPEARRLLAALGADRAEPPVAARRRRADRHARARRPGAGTAARLVRRRSGPGVLDHAQGLRPARQGLRAGVQRHVPDRRQDAERRGRHAKVQQLADTLGDTEGLASVSPPVPSPNNKIALIEARPSSAPQDKATSDLINSLRDDVIPANADGLQVYVGGITAIFDDFAGVLTDKLPQFIAVIVLLGCLLLMIAFRSILIPVTAAVMNLLAAGAAFGVVTRCSRRDSWPSRWGSAPDRSRRSCR